MARLKLGEILLQQCVITDTQLKKAIAAQQLEKGRIGEILVKLGIIIEEDIVAALATQLLLPHSSKKVDLLKPQANQGLEKIVSKNFAEKNLVLPLSIT